MSTIKISETKEYVSVSETTTKINVVESSPIKTSLIIANSNSIVNVNIARTDLVSVVSRGPAGPAGSSFLLKECGEILQANRVVYSLDNKIYTASSNNPTVLGRLVGITLSSGIVSSIIPVQNKEVFTNTNWNFIISSPVFLGINGELTQDSNQDILYPIGNVIDTNKILINIGYPIVRRL
jgi:hypothetical protein